MTYNVLIDTPPDKFGGVSINTSFRAVLEFFRVLESNDTETKKANDIIHIFFSSPPLYDNDKTWEFIIWYITRGENPETSGKKNLFDWDIDAGRVYSAFIQTYGIDLLKIDLHWWVFKDLFDSLPSNTKLNDVIEIRNKKLDPKSDVNTRKELMRMKNAYRINKHIENNQFPI